MHKHNLVEIIRHGAEVMYQGTSQEDNSGREEERRRKREQTHLARANLFCLLFAIIKL